ncbi:MAG: tail fiber domain-containing protein [Myxococcales bacterium]|nr:tail fiber domain-containing protein [Myxococcales bacterium]
MKHLVSMLACLALVACSNAMPGPTGSTGPAGPMGTPGATGPAGEPVRVNVLMRGNVDCPTGGVELVSVDGRRVVCNGASVAADGGGVQGPAGPPGPAGMNGTNGTNGANGTNGTNGANGLDGISVTIATEPPGANCAAGGISATGYVDLGLGDAGIATRYVCNGAAGMGGSGGAPRLPDGGLNPNAILYVGADGGVQTSPELSWGGSFLFAGGSIQIGSGGDRFIGPGPTGVRTNLEISAGSATQGGGGASGGNLDLRAGNANRSGGVTPCNLSQCTPGPSANCPGPDENSVRIFAGDNSVGQTWVCNDVRNGDVEFYAGNGQPERMRIVGNTGNVGIGTSTPSQRLHVIGNILASGTVSPSDARLKENIHGIERSRELLRLLHGVHYTWNKEAQAKFGTTGAGDVGLLAQDVQKVVPEAVVTLPDGTLTVNYDKVLPLLVEALKAQDEKLRDLEQTNARLKALERRLEQLERH